MSSGLAPPKTDFSEIRRRQGISKAATVATPADVDTMKPSVSWMDPSQRFALVNLANRELRPKSVYPAFRVLGLFPSVEDATKFGRQISASMVANIYLVETCKWNLIPQCTEKTPEECFIKLESLLIAFYKNVVLDKLEFEHRRSQNTSTVVDANVFENPSYFVAVQELEKRGVSVDTVSTELLSRISKDKQDLFEKFQDHIPSPPPPSTSQPPEGKVEFTETMLRAEEDHVHTLPENQRFIVCSVMLDSAEPAFCLYAALPTLQESKGFLQFILKKEAPTHDKNCCDMGRWIYPESGKEMDKYGLSTYPLDEQNRIMQWHHMNKNQMYSNMEGIDILSDRKIDAQGNIIDNPQGDNPQGDVKHDGN